MEMLPLSVLILSWLLFSVGAALIARKKRRSEISFFILSLILSPVVGLIAAAVARPGEEIGSTTHEEFGDSGTFRRCPYCEEIVKRDAEKCRFCGADLVPAFRPERGD